MTRGVATNKKVRKILKIYGKKTKNLDITKSAIGNIIKKFGATKNSNRKQKSCLVKICKHQNGTIRDIQTQWEEEANLYVSKECFKSFNDNPIRV